jgi:L-histidine N-alpha-methyltransferase
MFAKIVCCRKRSESAQGTPDVAARAGRSTMKASSPATFSTAERHDPALTTPAGRNGRLQLEVLRQEPLARTLAHDLQRGLRARPKSVPAKYFYDDRGSELFDAICRLPEYYLTRTGQALLESSAAEIGALVRPRAVVELGCGMARSTRVLLDVVARQRDAFRYLPFDVSEGTLRRAAGALLRDYPNLHIHALVGDYERDLDRLPPGDDRLVLFLGSTIGNFTPAATADFLRGLRRQLARGEHFLVGVDLVKPIEVLEAAYNDSAGVTAEFNRNVLRVINRHLDADFDPERFEHVAFFNQKQSQIEMHLRARGNHSVTIRALDMTLSFAAGETIHTEISRKFSHAEVRSMLADAGFSLVRWYTPGNRYFALALAEAI